MKYLVSITVLVAIFAMSSVCYGQSDEDMKRYNDYQFIPSYVTKDKNAFKILDSAAIVTPKKYPINMLTVCVDGYEVVVISQSNGNSSFQLLDNNGNGIVCKK